MPEFAVVVYAGCVGLTAAGFAGSFWTLMTGRPPSLNLLLVRNMLFPLVFLTLFVHVPVMLCGVVLGQGRTRPVRSGAALILAMFWSFMQGVFILTQFFGVR